jgi:hypothetical protein
MYVLEIVLGDLRQLQASGDDETAVRHGPILRYATHARGR